MSWKYYKKLFESGGIDENKFILGIDLGTSSSALAFFNTVTEEPELIDLSGGYGRPSMPSVVQFIPETKEWIFGEYALLNKGLFDDCTVTDLMKKIGKKEYIEMGSKTVSAVWLLSKYIKELIESCKNINPSCEIAGIVCAVPTYFSDEAKEELLSSFRGAGLEKQLIGFVSSLESILLHNYYTAGKEESLTLVVDYGADKMRASVLRLKSVSENETGAVTEGYFEDETLGFNTAEKEIAELFTRIYCEEKQMSAENLTEQERNNLYIFSHQNKTQIFKLNSNGKPSKLYFNFAFPPFVRELNNETKLSFIEGLEKKIEGFFERLFKNTRTNVGALDFGRVVCAGGGFESPFAKSLIEKTFQNAAVTMLKNGKAMQAEGAAIYAAKRLGIYACEDFFIQDSSLLKSDIGVLLASGDSGRFFPIAERNTFWWRERKGIVFTLTKSSESVKSLKFYLRSKAGAVSDLCEIALLGLEKRPKGATRLKINVRFEEFQKVKLTVEDFGFGEMFPKTGFIMEETVDLANLG